MTKGFFEKLNEYKVKNPKKKNAKKEESTEG